MEKTDKKNSKNKSLETSGSLVSNPIEKIGEEIEKAKKRLKTVRNNSNPFTTEKKEYSAPKNPFAQNQNFNSIVETINHFNTSKTKLKIYTPQVPDTSVSVSTNTNFAEVMSNIAGALQNNTSLINLFSQLNNLFVIMTIIR